MVVSPKHPKMINVSRKTNGCWVPPFKETPMYSQANRCMMSICWVRCHEQKWFPLIKRYRSLFWQLLTWQKKTRKQQPHRYPQFNLPAVATLMCIPSLCLQKSHTLIPHHKQTCLVVMPLTFPTWKRVFVCHFNPEIKHIWVGWWLLLLISIFGCCI